MVANSMTIQANTIKTKHRNGFKVKYRTERMGLEEFNSNLYNTYHDWQSYLSRSLSYYQVK